MHYNIIIASNNQDNQHEVYPIVDLIPRPHSHLFNVSRLCDA